MVTDTLREFINSRPLLVSSLTFPPDVSVADTSEKNTKSRWT